MYLIKELLKNGVISTQHVTLKSGQKKNLYFDFRQLSNHPKLLQNISYELSKLITFQDKVLVGVPMGGIPYAVQVSNILNMPYIIVRNDTKEYGLRKQLDGYDDKVREVVIIEDVITSGGSVIDVINILNQYSIKVVQIICILDREAGGCGQLREMGYNVKSLYTLSNMVDLVFNYPQIYLRYNKYVERLVSIVKSKQTNVVVSLDLEDENEIMKVIDRIGDHICAVKLHYDIIRITNYDNFVDNINRLKKSKNIMIIEDRKYADIPFIVLKQVKAIQRYADIITIHGICGEFLIKELNNIDIGILPVHQLSVKENLIDNLYSNRLVDTCNKYENIIGFVSQQKVEGYLTFTPGVNLDIKSDNKGQQYNNVDDLTTDLFIIGRGIYDNGKDILDNTKKYKDVCIAKWNHVSNKFMSKL